jgi:hypothetical protein
VCLSLLQLLKSQFGGKISKKDLKKVNNGWNILILCIIDRCVYYSDHLEAETKFASKYLAA